MHASALISMIQVICMKETKTRTNESCTFSRTLRANDYKPMRVCPNIEWLVVCANL